MARQCTCGADITHRPDWQSLCYPCWLRANPHRAHGAGRAYATGQRPQAADAGRAYTPGPTPTTTAPGYDALRADYVRVQDSLVRAVAELARVTAQRDAAQRQAAELLRRTRDGNAPAPATFSGYLRKLIQLCHPDKHAGSETANEVTAWLLSQRSR